MSGSFQEPEGATPHTIEERDGLLLEYITTREELDRAEAANIADAMVDLGTRRRSFDVLNPANLNKLHQMMYGSVWEWAGKNRWTEKSIGVDPARIQEELGRLLGDVKYWIEHKTFAIDEIALRFHHRLVYIHLYPNGNGRHARLATDLLLQSLGAIPFSWGSADLVRAGDNRTRYIAALRAADRVIRTADESHYALLKAFVRS